MDHDEKEGVTMPLHDWADDRGWDSVHQLWINALLFWAQDRLPSGYRGTGVDDLCPERDELFPCRPS